MKTQITFCLAVLFLAGMADASVPEDYLGAGRELLFDGSVDGIVASYEVFDEGINDPMCPGCGENSELRFFRALSATAMLFMKDDSAPVDSFREIVGQFGIGVVGMHWSPYVGYSMLEIEAEEDMYGRIAFPLSSPDAAALGEMFHTGILPAIDAIVGDLEAIDDSPEQPFQVVLQPAEVQMFFPPENGGMYDPFSGSYSVYSELLAPVEVDYADVLLLKAMLHALKAQILMHSAYDASVQPEDRIIERVQSNDQYILVEVLDARPHLLRILPTDETEGDGAAALLAARADYKSALTSLIAAVDYLMAAAMSGQPQEGKLTSIDPDCRMVDAMRDHILLLLDSLENDRANDYLLESVFEYEMAGAETSFSLELRMDPLGVIWGDLLVHDDSETIYYDIEEAQFSPDHLAAEVFDWWNGNQGYLWLDMCPDTGTILDGEFSWWGYDNGTISGLNGSLVEHEEMRGAFDPNPIFGGTTRYPEPVVPRDLLPQFNRFNIPVPGTIGHGLNNDATLGGILPDMHQEDWQDMLELQSDGVVYPTFRGSRVITLDGDAEDWVGIEPIFTDPQDAAGNMDETLALTDVEAMYMAFDAEYLYILVTYYEGLSASENWLDIGFSYEPGNPWSQGSYLIFADILENYESCSLYHLENPWWGDYLGDVEMAAGDNAIEMRIPLSMLPEPLAGRFISIDSFGFSSYGYTGESNWTYLQLGDLATITGTVACPGHPGSPIFIQAYNNLHDPERSVISSTMITEPGPYTLYGVGVGWSGYVRAFTSVLDPHPFGIDAFGISEAMPVTIFGSMTAGVDFAINLPEYIDPDQTIMGVLDGLNPRYFRFDAIEGGNYTLAILADHGVRTTLFAYDGSSILGTVIGTGAIHFDCDRSGIYYLKVEPLWPDGSSGELNFEMSLESLPICSRADIAGRQWIRVKDCVVDYYDFAILGEKWLSSCSEPDWCAGADINRDGVVDMVDLGLLCLDWLDSGKW